MRVVAVNQDYIFERTQPEPNSGCWLWLRAADRLGYGHTGATKDIRERFGTVMAHRVSYIVFKGPIPPGLVLDHKCRNPSCVNPDHLDPVTQRENVRRGEVAWNLKAKTHCPRGHAYDRTYTRVSGGTVRYCHECKLELQRQRRAQMKCEAVHAAV